MSAPLAVLAAGGTGGHMFPAQALAEELLRRGWRVALATDERGMRYAGGFPESVERRELRSGSFSRGGLVAKLAVPTALARGVLEARSWFRKTKPAIVIGFGGYPSVPSMAAAGLCRIPRLIHEQNGVLGQANRLFMKRVEAIAAGTGRPVNLPEGIAVEDIGNPIRDAVHQAMQQGYEAAPEGPLRLVIFGGSQGASVFSEIVPQAISQLPEAMRARLHLTQQARAGEVAQVEEAYRKAALAAAEVAPFFDAMPDLIANAHLVIARSGASSCAELAAIGRPSILVPLPSANADEQTANARYLERAGAAILAPQETLSAQSLAAMISTLLDDPQKLSQMAAAARGAGKPDAAQALADLVERHALTQAL